MGHPYQKIPTSTAIQQLLQKYRTEKLAVTLNESIRTGMSQQIGCEMAIMEIEEKVSPETIQDSHVDDSLRAIRKDHRHLSSGEMAPFIKRIRIAYQNRDHRSNEQICQSIQTILRDLRAHMNKLFLLRQKHRDMKFIAWVHSGGYSTKHLRQRMRHVVKKFNPEMMDAFILGQDSYNTLSRSDKNEHLSLLYRTVYNVHRKDILCKPYYNGRAAAGDALLHKGLMNFGNTMKNIDKVNTSLLRQLTRLDNVEFKALMDELHRPEYDEDRQVMGNITFQEQLLIFLTYLSLGFSMRELTFVVGRSTFTCSNVISGMMPLMTVFSRKFIPPMDSPQARQSREGGDFDRYHFDKYVFGGILREDETPTIYVDGTVIPVDIQGLDREGHRDHKGTIGFNVMVGVDKSFRVQFVHTGAEARSHDYAVYEDAIEQGVLVLRGGETCFGDAAFPTNSTCAGPYKMISTHFMEIRRQKRVSLKCCYNFLHDIKRNKIERLFGVVKGKFRVLKKGVNLSRHANVIIQSVFSLHNFLLDVKSNYKEDIVNLARLQAEERALRSPALRPTNDDLLALESFASSKVAPTGSINARRLRNPFLSIEEREQSIPENSKTYTWDDEFMFPEVTERENPMRTMYFVENSMNMEQDAYRRGLLQQYGSLTTNVKNKIKTTIKSQHVRKLLSVASRHRFVQAQHISPIDEMIKVVEYVHRSRTYRELEGSGNFTFSNLPTELYTRYGKALREFRALLGWYYFLITVKYMDDLGEILKLE